MSIILVAVVSLGIAFFKSATIMEVVQYAWTGLGCSFGPLVLMALYSKKTTRAGAIAGIIVGGFIAGLWPVINPWVMDRVIPSMIPGFLGSLGAIWAVSRLTTTQQE